MGLVVVLPSMVAGSVLAMLSATALIDQSQQWWRVSFSTALCAAIATALLTMLVASDPVNNVLGRDIVATLVLGATLPLAYATIGRLTHRRWAIRALTVVSIVAALVASLPLWFFVILSVHCSSGDCL
jgi:hypothetical protein